MRKSILTIILAVLPALATAAGGGVHLDKAPVNLGDQASLQRGAKLFVNYCLSCHSAKYMRYNRMGQDLGLTDDQVRENFLFAGEKVGDTMTVSMPSDLAKNWFGVVPPDLSVVARARGADWVYTYLRSFYVDESRPFGVNNTVFPDVGMPHVLWEMEGFKKPVFETVSAEGGDKQVMTGFEPASGGSMSAEEFETAMGDLTNFLVYLGEPVQLARRHLGIWVMVFLGIFTFLAYLLKKEYWKDVH